MRAVKSHALGSINRTQERWGKEDGEKGGENKKNRGKKETRKRENGEKREKEKKKRTEEKTNQREGGTNQKGEEPKYKKGKLETEGKTEKKKAPPFG